RRGRRRPRTLEQFLGLVGGEDEDSTQQDVGGIELHVSLTPMNALRRLVEFMTRHPQWLRAFQDYVRSRDAAGGDDPDADDEPA
ncbi:MAG: hypothetical protein DIU84_10185, partial [Bacillota bacterium]